MKFFAIAALVMTSQALRIKQQTVATDDAGDMADEAIAAVDANDDDKISLDELLEFAQEKHTEYCAAADANADYCTDAAVAKGKKWLKKAFKAADTNGDKFVDKKELVAVLKKHM